MKIQALLIAGVLFLTGFSLAPLVPRAQAVIATCPGDYYSFLLTARSAATRKQTFSDFFKLGYCQLSDIMELESELDTLRDSFQSAANACQDTSEYKTAYVETLMEEYFVRHIQESKPDVLNPVDEERLKALKAEKLSKLKEEMMLLFVEQEHKVTKDVFETYYTNWSSKYDDRIANYAHCEEGAWAELQDTWQDFVDHIKELSIEVEKQEFSVEDQSDTEGNETEMSEFGQSFINAYEYLKSKKEQQQAEVPAAPTTKGIADSGKSTSFAEALKELKGGDESFAIQTNGADRMANYELLYGAGGAVAATDMQSVLVYMNQVLMETNTKDFPNIKKSAEQVYGKQCQ
jgi:hypothetical protein